MGRLRIIRVRLGTMSGLKSNIAPSMKVPAAEMLQPPYETHGNQVAPTVSMNDWFQKRGQAMLAGQTYNQLITIDASGQANGKKPYWNWDYKDIAPRISFAWSPSSEAHHHERTCTSSRAQAACRG